MRNAQENIRNSTPAETYLFVRGFSSVMFIRQTVRYKLKRSYSCALGFQYAPNTSCYQLKWLHSYAPGFRYAPNTSCYQLKRFHSCAPGLPKGKINLDCKWSYPPGLLGWGFNTPPTPRVISYPLRLPPINWFPKGNKKPRVGSGVQILKDKRLG